MNIIEVNIDELVEYENNPRHNESAIEKVKSSIKEFGFKVPIIIDKDNVIITGHTRTKAAKLLGMKTVPTIRATDLNEEQVKAFRLADNKTQEFADWDFDLLEKELEAIKNIDMNEMGFSMDLADINIDDIYFDSFKEHQDNKLNLLKWHGGQVETSFEDEDFLNDTLEMYDKKGDLTFLEFLRTRQ